jgi:hypothetical protein
MNNDRPIVYSPNLAALWRLPLSSMASLGLGKTCTFSQHHECCAPHLLRDNYIRNVDPLNKKNLDRLGMMYTTLQPTNEEIRLLTVSPGKLNDELECNLNVVSLTSDPSYIALSYCWGDEKLRGVITVDDNKVSVTQSLEDALRYLRSGTKVVVVWADAICIHQTDDEEKSFQISFMGKIYSQGK